MLIIFGDNPERIRSEAAFAKRCGACPVPASSGMTTGRHRLYRGGHRQANAALHRAVVVRMRYHRCFRHQLLLPRPYLVLTKPLRLDIQCQRGASVKIGWKYLDDYPAP